MKTVAASFVPPIALDPRKKVPLYLQVCEWFRDAIIAGQMRPGQRVPSTRILAAELKVSRIPVLNAYEQMIAEGYFEAVVGAGTCVAASIPDDIAKNALDTAVVRTRNPRPSPERRPPAVRRMSRRGAALTELPSQPWLNVIGAFRVSLPALDFFPHGEWSKLMARHSRRPAPGLMAYGDAMGYQPLREAIAEYLGTTRAVRCDASQVLVTTGSQQGLQLSAQVLVDQDDRVLMEEPGYPSARQAFLAAGAELIPVPVDREGLNISEGAAGRAARNARAVYITPSHQYPLGMTMSAARRMLLLNWAVRTGAWIIEDDYDSEYRFGARPVTSLQGLDTNAKVIYVGTFSKVMFPALRVGYLVVPKDLVSAFCAARDAADVFSATLYQAVLTDFIREGHFARHIRRMRMLYKDRRRILTEEIHSQMPGRLDVMGAEAGMHLTALLPRGSDDVAISKRAAARGVSATPLSTCYMNSQGHSGLILGYGGVNTEQIRSGIRNLTNCL
jgi:GntR family transcriptional regulator/MocR family aminotransferase